MVSLITHPYTVGADKKLPLAGPINKVGGERYVDELMLGVTKKARGGGYC